MDFDVQPERVEAYRHGPVGWANVQSKISFF